MREADNHIRHLDIFDGLHPWSEESAYFAFTSEIKEGAKAKPTDPNNPQAPVVPLESIAPISSPSPSASQPSLN